MNDSHLESKMAATQNREFDITGIFLKYFRCLAHCWLTTTQDPSLSTHGYQSLPLATSQLVCNNREFDVSGILEVFYSLFMEGSL